MTRLDDLERLYAEAQKPRAGRARRRAELQDAAMDALLDLIAVARAAEDFVLNEAGHQAALGKRFYALADTLAHLEGDKA